jgi:predicted aspartyl protease
MGVRVKLGVKALDSKSSLELSSLLNTGFESEMPELILPIRVAELLGFWPELPRGKRIKNYETPGGVAKMYYLANALEVRAVTGDKETKPVRCAGVISEVEREVLASDKLIDKLDIAIESAGEGIWRFRGESKLRKSQPVQYW